MKTYIFLIFFQIFVNSNNLIRSSVNINNVEKYNIDEKNKINPQVTIKNIEKNNHDEPLVDYKNTKCCNATIKDNDDEKKNITNKLNDDTFTIKSMNIEKDISINEEKKKENIRNTENDMENNDGIVKVKNLKNIPNDNQEEEQEKEIEENDDLELELEEQKDNEDEKNELEQDQENQEKEDEEKEEQEEEKEEEQEELGGAQKEMDKKEMEKKKMEKKEMENKEMENKEMEKKEMEKKEMEKKERERKEMEKKEMEKKERERKEREKKEREKKEREKKEIREIREKIKERKLNKNIEFFKNYKNTNSNFNIDKDEDNKNIGVSCKNDLKLSCNKMYNTTPSKIKYLLEEKGKNIPNNNLRTIKTHDHDKDKKEKMDEIIHKDDDNNDMKIDRDSVYEERKQKILLIHLLKNIKDLLDRQRDNFYNFLSFLSENYASYENLYSTKKNINSKENRFNKTRDDKIRNTITTSSFLSLKDSLSPIENMGNNFIKNDNEDNNTIMKPKNVNIKYEQKKRDNDNEKESDIFQLKNALNKIIESNVISDKQKDYMLLIKNILEIEDEILNKEKLQYNINQKMIPILNEKSDELKNIALKLSNENKESQNSQRVDLAQNIVSNLLNLSVELKNTGNIVYSNIQGQGELIQNIENNINKTQKDLQDVRSHISNEPNNNENENKENEFKKINEINRYQNICNTEDNSNNASDIFNSTNCLQNYRFSPNPIQTKNNYKKFKVDESMKKYFFNIFVKEAVMLKKLYKMLYDIF
ncbi:rhoptry-associated leucine zipper-like protein 1, putative [Plasmodium gallinaceum]|uniref:Rhoptry-associated leucine zipper-like protein 1, putative n=1 Tax=Plasmodium gallinaceum TaxID=5849 RepID=A0A1J1GPV7_PLAGA|nr:rhoptry-associated leucine zipper-like protein 1, putative [Plasmodium gallinaceum]CRG94453.1 rhoptry-associated leucine zipper-like protein 1, putative [Plasmodium gallinaceum]